jgi:hypothetical protein
MTYDDTYEHDDTARWRERGAYDAARDRAPLFRSTRAYGIVPELEVPADWTLDDIQARGEAYLQGYRDAEEAAFAA